MQQTECNLPMQSFCMSSVQNVVTPVVCNSMLSCKPTSANILDMTSFEMQQQTKMLMHNKCITTTESPNT